MAFLNLSVRQDSALFVRRGSGEKGGGGCMININIEDLAERKGFAAENHLHPIQHSSTDFFHF